jgi:hypothetical protein
MCHRTPALMKYAVRITASSAILTGSQDLKYLRPRLQTNVARSNGLFASLSGIRKEGSMMIRKSLMGTTQHFDLFSALFQRS